MEKIKIVHIMVTSAFSGPDATVFSLFKKLDPEKYQQYLIFLSGPKTVNHLLVERSRKIGIESVLFHIRGKLNLWTLWKIISFIRRHRINILHSHNYKTDILTYLATRFYSAHCVTTLHGFTERNWRLKLYKWLDLKILKYYDRIKVVSRPLLELVLQRGIPQQKVSYIPNAIDLDLMVYQKENQIALRHEFGIKKRDTLVGMIGRLDGEKNPGLLLDALPNLIESFPYLKCFFIGEGELREKLILQADKDGLASVAFFPGYREDARVFISLLDLVIIPSWTEGIPKILLESMAFKKPVVATAVGGIPDIIVDGENGFLVPPGDIDALIGRVKMLLFDPELRRLFGDAGRLLMVAEYSDRRMVAQMDEFYEKISL
jgi:glycosyltransferase involved in cell wall biosynthesis